MPANSLFTLLKKDILLELRQQHTLYGILLYVAATIFIIYITMGQPDDTVWNAMFWVVQLFVCVNAVAKSFLQDSKGRMLYYYSVTGPANYVLSKLIFNVLLMLIMTAITIVLFVILLGNPLVHALQFIGISFLGGLGLSLTFTFLAAIASKAQQQASLMAIMGFPLMVPQLLLLGRISKIAFSSVIVTEFWKMTGMLLLFDVLIIVLSMILFPFLWKD